MAQQKKNLWDFYIKMVRGLGGDFAPPAGIKPRKRHRNTNPPTARLVPRAFAAHRVDGKHLRVSSDGKVYEMRHGTLYRVGVAV